MTFGYSQIKNSPKKQHPVFFFSDYLFTCVFAANNCDYIGCWFQICVDFFTYTWGDDANFHLGIFFSDGFFQVQCLLAVGFVARTSLVSTFDWTTETSLLGKEGGLGEKKSPVNLFGGWDPMW